MHNKQTVVIFSQIYRVFYSIFLRLIHYRLRKVLMAKCKKWYVGHFWCTIISNHYILSFSTTELILLYSEYYSSPCLDTPVPGTLHEDWWKYMIVDTQNTLLELWSIVCQSCTSCLFFSTNTFTSVQMYKSAFRHYTHENCFSCLEQSCDVYHRSPAIV